MVKRYAINLAQGSKIEHKYGAWVEHAELEACEIELKITKAAADEYRELVERVIKFQPMFGHTQLCAIRIGGPTLDVPACDCGADELAKELDTGDSRLNEGTGITDVEPLVSFRPVEAETAYLNKVGASIPKAFFDKMDTIFERVPQPCPFCGKEPVMVPVIPDQSYAIMCLNLNCHVHPRYPLSIAETATREEAIEAWNTRA